MERLILIKLGGSLITDKDKDRTARPEVIERLAKELLEAGKTFDGKIIVAHGAGSFPHRPAAEYKTNEGNLGPLHFKGVPIVADRAIELNRIVIKQFLEADLPAVSFSPESLIMSEDRKPISTFTDPLLHALGLGYIPVLYGDLIFDKKIGFCIYSTEMVLGALAGELADRFKISFVYCGDTDGVYDADGKTIPVISHKNIKEVEQFITGSGKIDVTGGMIHKVEESLRMAENGFETLIINGKRSGELIKAIMRQDHQGTLITD